MKKNQVHNELRPSRMMIRKQQGMEVLGVDLFSSVSFKDPYAVHPLVMLNACLTLSWSDKSFRPRNRVVQLRPDTPFCWSAHPVGSKDVRGSLT